MGTDCSGILVEVMCPLATESHVVKCSSKWGFYQTNRTQLLVVSTFNMEYGTLQACVCMTSSGVAW